MYLDNLKINLPSTLINKKNSFGQEKRQLFKPYILKNASQIPSSHVYDIKREFDQFSSQNSKVLFSDSKVLQQDSKSLNKNYKRQRSETDQSTLLFYNSYNVQIKGNKFSKGPTGRMNLSTDLTNSKINKNHLNYSMDFKNQNYDMVPGPGAYDIIKNFGHGKKTFSLYKKIPNNYDDKKVPPNRYNLKETIIKNTRYRGITMGVGSRSDFTKTTSVSPGPAVYYQTQRVVKNQKQNKFIQQIKSKQKTNVDNQNENVQQEQQLEQ